MANPLDTGGNVQVDFVWGNLPMQPDDQRGMATLDPALDNHIIAATMYNGFPGYTPVPPFTDTTANVSVPDVVGALLNTANSTLVAAGLSQTSTTTFVGATVANDGTVKSQVPAAATTVNVGTNVALVVFNAPEVPDLLGMTATAAEAALVAVGLTLGVVTGETGVVTDQSVAAATTVDAGTAIDITIA